MNILILSSCARQKELSAIFSRLKIKYNTSFFMTDDLLVAFNVYLKEKPSLIILDNNHLGRSFAKTLYDMKSCRAAIYMIADILDLPKLAGLKIGVDFYIKASDLEFLEVQLEAYIQKYMPVENSEVELERAEEKQLKYLSGISKYNNDKIHINYIYSPYQKLSGDYILLWQDEDINKLYGILFDCEGHDLLSWQQAGIVVTYFNIAIRQFKQKILGSLSEIMKNVNQFVMPENLLVAAISFQIDIKEKKLIYCAAGVPSFFKKDKDQTAYEECLLCSKNLGQDIKTSFVETEIPLMNTESLIFCSDGLSDMNFEKADKADDVSALFIDLEVKH